MPSLKTTCYFYSQSREGELSEEDPVGAKTQVRIVTRDMSGKHAWDFTLFYGPNSKTEVSQSPFDGRTSANLATNEIQLVKDSLCIALYCKESKVV